MTPSGLPHPASDAPIPYEIRIRGAVDETWGDLLDTVLSIKPLEPT